jgi:hypothetical protein
MGERYVVFAGARAGPWRVAEARTIAGEALPGAAYLALGAAGEVGTLGKTAWTLRGMRSHERYTPLEEKLRLTAVQASLGRRESTRAALIPIRKNAAWWALSQDQRREIFEERSGHIAIGLEYLPPIARRLYHCRDLSEDEPFDFLTWFEYAPSCEQAFCELLTKLRATEEWKYVERECELRLTRQGA